MGQGISGLGLGGSEAELRELTKTETHSVAGVFKAPLALQKNVQFYH